MRDVNYDLEWASRLDEDAHASNAGGTRLTDSHFRESAYRTYPRFLLFCFCEKYRQAHATKWQPLEGDLPAKLYLIDKHHWLPEQALALREDQILLLLQSELKELRLPVNAHQTLQSEFQLLDIHDLPLNPPDLGSHA